MAEADESVQDRRTDSTETPGGPSNSVLRAFLATGLTWLVPGLGHWFLGKRGRALAFFGVVASFILLGFVLHGKLYVPVAGSPLSYLATFTNLGMGPLFLIVQIGAKAAMPVFETLRAGDPTTVTYEHGTTFLLTAGILNILTMLDAWDIATGRKE